MPEKKKIQPKRHDRYHRMVMDYSEASFHQNEEIILLLTEIKDLLKKKSEK